MHAIVTIDNPIILQRFRICKFHIFVPTPVVTAQVKELINYV